jgi:hypothetical protein
MKVQGPGGDQFGSGRGPHARTTSLQVRIMATIQGGQNDKQTHLLARNRAFHQQHSNLPTFLYLRAWGPERPMPSIMEHA